MGPTRYGTYLFLIRLLQDRVLLQLRQGPTHSCHHLSYSLGQNLIRLCQDKGPTHCAILRQGPTHNL